LGVYDKAIEAMDILSPEYCICFSSCYHSKNYKTIASVQFLDICVKKVLVRLLFLYIHVGSNADTSLDALQSKEHKYRKDQGLLYET
jgi:hypothetical protein